MNGNLVCTTCRTCPHDLKVWDSPCTLCLQHLYTAWDVTGPRISRFLDYIAMAKGLNLEPAEVFVWTDAEEELLMSFAATSRRGSAAERWMPYSPPARTEPFPFPLLHHLARENAASIAIRKKRPVKGSR